MLPAEACPCSGNAPVVMAAPAGMPMKDSSPGRVTASDNPTEAAAAAAAPAAGLCCICAAASAINSWLSSAGGIWLAASASAQTEALPYDGSHVLCAC